MQRDSCLMRSAISLFTGIGGLDYGFEAAGFETRVALELDSHACKSIRENRHWPLLEGDINSISSARILETGGLSPGEPDVLFGGPPCQPFSKSSYWVRGDSLRLDDPRADTLTGYLRVLRDTKPKAFLLENVAGLAFKNKDEGLRLIVQGIEQINKECGTNYRPVWQALNCVDFGIPQRRERIFIIGAREGTEFRFPEPTHFDPEANEPEMFRDQQPYATAWDAIGDLKEPNDLRGLEIGGKWGDLLPSIPEGQNYLWHTNRNPGEPLFGWRTRYWSFLLKLAKGKPSWTIQAQPGSAIGPFHWNNRKLTFEELCRIQTFPDGLVMTSGRTEMQRMLGNAVPSLMAETLALAIDEQLLGGRRMRSRSLLRRCDTPMPEPEKVKKVPEKYLHLRGNYADHPGTGKGRRGKKNAA
jgi:DNA (cytosine-5)-methyltransferase 1